MSTRKRTAKRKLSVKAAARNNNNSTPPTTSHASGGLDRRGRGAGVRMVLVDAEWRPRSGYRIGPWGQSRLGVRQAQGARGMERFGSPSPHLLGAFQDRAAERAAVAGVDLRALYQRTNKIRVPSKRRSNIASGFWPRWELPTWSYIVLQGPRRFQARRFFGQESIRSAPR